MATKPYIAPGDLTTEEVGIVLDFFNTVATAQQIADGIEIPFEFDVGVRVGGRILRRREELGGAFDSVQQIADVPYVGPERFTEIVVALTDHQLPGAPPSKLELQTAIRQLQARVGADYVLQLQVNPREFFIGQPVHVVVTVTSRDGRPKPNVAFTIATSWGRLSTASGFVIQSGQVVRALTHIDGRANLQLASATYEDLTPAQQSALESALRRLDPTAAAPGDDPDGLQAFVDLYRVERNHELRNAIDIHFHARHDGIANAINQHDHLNHWRRFEPLITAYVHDVDEEQATASAVRISNSVPLSGKDWLGAFFTVYARDLEQNDNLRSSFKTVANTNENSGILLEQIVGEVHTFLAADRGVLGTAARRQLADASLTRFVGTDTAELPLATRLSLFPGLRAAAQNVGANGVGAIGLVSQSREDVRNAVTEQLADVGSQLGELTEIVGRIGALETQLGAFQSQLTTFNTQFEQFEAGIAAFDTNVATFDNELRSFRTEADAIRNDPGFRPIGPGTGGTRG